jgi:hypothetical protein
MAALVAAAPALVAGPGTSGGNFLKIPAFSRGSSLGGAWVAMAEGTGALYYNPAGVGRGTSGEISVSHAELYQDLRLDNVSITYPFRNGSGIGFGLTYLGYGTINGYDIAGNATGLVSAYSFSISAAYSQRVTEILSVGVAVKPVFERLGDYTAQTVTFDLGAIAELGQLSMGARLANLGGSLKYVDESVKLPTMLCVGAAYRTLETNSVISVAASKDNEGIYALGSGLEYRYNSNLIFRCGYGATLENRQNASDGFGLGIGLDIQPITVDYAYRPSGSLDGIHQITGSFHFGS